MDYETGDVVVREVDGVTIVRMKNANFDGMAEIQRISAELDLMLERGVRQVILDFKYVKHAGSAALGMMISLQKKMEKVEGKLILSHAEKIEELLKVSRTSQLFKLAPDPRAAFKMF